MRPPGIGLRRASDADREFLARVFVSGRAHELALLPWTNPQKEAFLHQQFEAQDRHYRTYAGAESLVVLLDAMAIGRLYVQRTATEVRIMDITLLPEHRGQGVGRYLLRQLQSEAREAGIPVTLHVQAHNPAQRLYARLGFVRVADHGVYHQLEWRADVAAGR